MPSTIHDAIRTASTAPHGWLAFVGAMHGKKDLSAVQKVLEALPDGTGLLVAGDPMVDGVDLVRCAAAVATRHPHVAVVGRHLSDGEIDAVLAARPTVLIAEHIGTASLSGVLIEAVGAGCPVIAPADTASGDVTTSAGLGATYAHANPDAILAAHECAISEACSASTALARHGLLTGADWGHELLRIIEMPTRTPRTTVA
jgi:hypothetical protein